ncbi:MAG: HlyD family secretion protein [Selenomonadaceae bacterium]|nr:HlyD family secretion protein [Selenomonadaceae bacterium]
MDEMNQLYRRYRTALKAVTAGLFICIGLGIFYWQTVQAKNDNPGIWGMADAKEININSKVAGRIVALNVREGDRVVKGQLLAKIDRDYQEPAQHQAQATLAAQYAGLQQAIIAQQSAEVTLNANLRAAQAQLDQANTALNLAAKDESRYRELLAESAISVAEANVESARAALSQNDQNKAQVEASREQVAALQSQLDSVNVQLDETEIHAPFDGIITQKFVEEGMLISSSVPIFSLQDDRDNWIDFKIKETELKDFPTGSSVTVIGRDGSTKINGVVESVRRKSDFAAQKATSERGDTDIIAFNVKVRTNDQNIYPGMRFQILR